MSLPLHRQMQGKGKSAPNVVVTTGPRTGAGKIDAKENDPKNQITITNHINH